MNYENLTKDDLLSLIRMSQRKHKSWYPYGRKAKFQYDRCPENVCPHCHMILPMTGICDNCGEKFQVRTK